MSDPSQCPPARLAAAVDLLEYRRDRLVELRSRVDALAPIDMVVVEGERAVLTRLAAHLTTAREALRRLAEHTDDDDALDTLEKLVNDEAWTVLDEMDRLTAVKADLASQARAEVQRRLQSWDTALKDIERARNEVQRLRLRLDAPRTVVLGVRRTDALLRQAMIGDKEDKLLDAWRALSELDSSAADAPEVARENLPETLRTLIDDARKAAGRLQLTALRGPLARRRFEYTLMLLAPTGDQRIGINVQDSTTIVLADRMDFLHGLGEAHAEGRKRYLQRGTGRDARPSASTADPGPPSGDDIMSNLGEMGLRLYRLLLPDAMKKELEEHEKTPLTIITNDLELPWELMCDDSGFITLTRPVARMPVGRSLARRAPVVPRQSARVALIASAGPRNELRSAVSEVDKIKAGLDEALGDKVTVEVLGGTGAPPPTGKAFNRILLSGDYDIIHYAGHAMFDADRPDQSGLLLADKELCFAQKIQRLLRGNPLVFLNACGSARTRSSTRPPLPETHYQGDPREGLASAFLYGGALACVGTMWPVGDVEAADFAVAFYEKVLDGQPLGWAMRTAREAAKNEHPHDPSWASFVLYGDPSFIVSTPAHPVDSFI